MRSWRGFRPASLAALYLALLCGADPVAAVERIGISVEQIQIGASAAGHVNAQLDVISAEHSLVTVTVAEVDLPAALQAQTGRVTDIRLRCTDPVAREPRFACPALAVTAKAARLPPLAIKGRAELRSDTGEISIRGNGPAIAGSALRFALVSTTQGWQADASLPPVAIVELRKLLRPWFTLPDDLSLDGRIGASIKVRGKAQSTADFDSAELSAQGSQLNLQNMDATIIAEKLDFNVQSLLRSAAGALRFETRMRGTAGQLLAGPVLLDFTRNGLDLSARGSYAGGVVQMERLDATQRDLSQISASAVMQLQPLLVRSARLELESLTFPAAYASFMQISLTTTPFASLTTTGKASGAISIANNQPTALDLRVTDLNLQDETRELQVTGVNSELHWTADRSAAPGPSRLSWESARGWKIEGGKSRIDFATQDRDFRLLNAARLPFFDGAMVINALEARNIGSEQLEATFDATIEPISMTRISRALGLPEFSGQLAGRIPGLTYKDKLLTVQGNVEAQVFDGRVVASNLRVREPLGAWPRLYGDITARNLDLDLITRTFEFGSITGRLDGDVLGLETFNWSPVAFDARLATPGGDRSRHRISQKAVKNLSNIGGGGGGVAAALQSGALRFFEDFRYNQIGLSCRLKNDVCLMGGVGPAKTGYYIVRGSGLPRIDIIGNQERVDWPLLMAQIAAAVNNSGDIVVN